MSQSVSSTSLPDRNKPAEWLQTRPGEHGLIRVPAADTNGAYSLVEIVSDPGDGTPLHIHQNEDEYLLVLEGTARFALGDRVFDAEAGTMVTLPRNIPHAWGNRSDLRLRGASVAEGHFETIDDLQQDIAARPAGRAIAESNLVRRLVLAKGDPAKQRIRAQLSEIDDERLFGLGLTSEDIAALRGTASPPSEATISQGLDAPLEDSGAYQIRHRLQAFWSQRTICGTLRAPYRGANAYPTC